MIVSTKALPGIERNCNQTFYKPRNRTLDRYWFFSRTQEGPHFSGTYSQMYPQNASLGTKHKAYSWMPSSKFCRTKCFIQGRLCTEPKDQHSD